VTPARTRTLGTGGGLRHARPVAAAPDNETLADALERVADLLEVQGADGFRVRAYRRAAGTVRRHEEPLARVLERGGTDALDELPGIGRRIASQIAELVHTGRLSMLDRLEGEVSPEELLSTLPGIGPGLATRIHDELGVETLEELERAAHDGRLEQLEGFGERRVRGVRDALAGILGRAARRRARRAGASRAPEEPPVELLLELDAGYRERAAQGRLRLIAPRRFNPEGRRWLPVWHVRRGDVDYTLLFSNTARAHELGTTGDWVVIYAERDGTEHRYTVVTERSGPQRGQRVVRGREEECARLAGRRASGP